MAARGLLLFVSLVLLSAALASALGTSSRRSGDRPAASVPIAPSTGTGTPRVTARLPSQEPVRAKVGDVVELTVRAAEAGRVEIADLGVDVPVAPGEPATLLVLPDREGTFPITLRLTGERLGTLEVAGR